MKLTSLLLATARAGLIADDLLCMNPIAQPALKDDDDERVVGGSIASADTWKWIGTWFNLKSRVLLALSIVQFFARSQ